MLTNCGNLRLNRAQSSAASPSGRSSRTWRMVTHRSTARARATAANFDPNPQRSPDTYQYTDSSDDQWAALSSASTTAEPQGPWPRIATYTEMMNEQLRRIHDTEWYERKWYSMVDRMQQIRRVGDICGVLPHLITRHPTCPRTLAIVLAARKRVAELRQMGRAAPPRTPAEDWEVQSIIRHNRCIEQFRQALIRHSRGEQVLLGMWVPIVHTNRPQSSGTPHGERTVNQRDFREPEPEGLH